MKPQSPTFNEFCHLSARRVQFLSQVIHTALTGKRMAAEPAGSMPLREVAWIEMRLADIYRGSSPRFRRKLAAAEARFRNCTNQEAEAILAHHVEVLNEIEAKRNEVRHG